MVEASLAVSLNTCNAGGCGNPARSGRAPYCEKHYYQIRRNGHLGHKPKVSPPETIAHSEGYRLLYAPHHAVATKGQPVRVYEHRAVYHDHHGDGPFACFHCGVIIEWATMHVDHLDDDPANNAIANLAASCPICNQQRGRRKMQATIRRTRSAQIEWKGVTKSLPDWAEFLGVSRSMLRERLAKGWSVERLMTEPRSKRGPKPCHDGAKQQEERRTPRF